MVQSGDYSSNSGGEVSADLTGLYAGYALILLAAPTFGAAAAIGLLRVWRRPAPVDPMLRSHFVFQQRTLLAAVVAIIAGAVLILVNVGVFVLFVMAVWTIVRGALGLKDLLTGRPIAEPRRLFY
ncbi:MULTISPECIES: serine/threonine protein kinase [Brevundimonas]|uniref:serine/threonine protein kinase n=1 Tax=Brevundimonas sp. 357 TaxID=2555782 RepID=UPI000F76F015|nr:MULTISPECIES: serine/threonine protein kinase [Brevundimonas]RSB46175.1 serine/threonine protein kinase [Brevundimonas sp. 357]